MESSDSYKSIAGISTGTYREKASKFISFAIPVSSEKEVKEHLIRLRKEYYDANHHCYAYRIGHPEYVYRINDDGEPSSSAGKPIYGQILSRQLSDVLVVVIRYFGGTKLGIPGLIHAYKTTAQEALDLAKICTTVLVDRYTIKFNYLQMNDVMKILKQEKAEIISQEFDNDCKTYFSIRKSKSEKLKSRLSKLMNIYIYE